MPIAENFPEGLKPTGKINLDDGNFHIMWGPGKTTNTDGSQVETLADADVVAALGEDEIKEKFDMGYHTKHVDTIFKRVFG